MANSRLYLFVIAAQIGLDDVRVLAHFLWNIVGDLAAKIERNHLVRYAHYEAHVMLDEQDRNLEVVPHPSNELAERVKLFVIEPGSRLIKQQELGLTGERPPEFDSLLRAKGQV